MKTLGDLAALPLNKAIELDVLEDTPPDPSQTTRTGSLQNGDASEEPSRSGQAKPPRSRKAKKAKKS